MSDRKSARKPKAAPAPAPVEEEEEELSIISPEEEEEPAPAPTTKKTKAKATKKKARDPSPEPEPEPEKPKKKKTAAAPVAPAAAPVAKKAKAKVAPVEEEEKEEEEEVVAPGEPEKKKKKKRAPHTDRAMGSRLDAPKLYRPMLQKDRENRLAKTGKAPRKSRNNEVARREARFLHKANGLYLTNAYMHRIVAHCIEKEIPVIQAENDRVAARLKARGKNVPRHLTVATDWGVSPGFIQLMRGAAQIELDNVIRLSGALCAYSGRQTLSADDLSMAKKIASGEI